MFGHETLGRKISANKDISNLFMEVSLFALKKMVQRKRNGVAHAPPLPPSLIELQIPDEYEQYEMEPEQFKNFLLADMGSDAQRILLFGREGNLDTLEQSNSWYMDGTFRSAPLLFHQIYVILCERLGAVHPMIYGLLLPNKAGETYESVPSGQTSLS